MDATPKLYNIEEIELKPADDSELKFLYKGKMSKQINAMGEITEEQLRSAIKNAALVRKLGEDIQTIFSAGKEAAASQGRVDSHGHEDYDD